jgi:C-terminal processing protease CtpA/Prc
MRPDGTVFEGEGIAPDVEVQAKPADFEREDPILAEGQKRAAG